MNWRSKICIHRIECEQCVDDVCQPCDQQIVFSQGPDDIFEGHKGTNQLEINNLEPSTLYKLKVWWFTLMIIITCIFIIFSLCSFFERVSSF